MAIVAMCILAMFFTPAASASDSWQEAGILIDYGDGRTSWIWVPFEESDPSLQDLLEETDLEMVTVGFGGLGDAVCQIDDTGCPVGECRTRMCQTSSSSPFWRFLKLNGDEWAFMGTGIGGAPVADGEIYALSWSAETPELPIVSIDEFAANAGAERDVSSPVSAMRTEGESDQQNESTPAWAPAVAALGLVATAAGVLVLRGRSSRQAAA